jgi:hypothetical protein
MAGPFVLAPLNDGGSALLTGSSPTGRIAGIVPDLYNCTIKLELGAGVVKV